jgi:hypothetical protein
MPSHSAAASVSSSTLPSLILPRVPRSVRPNLRKSRSNSDSTIRHRLASLEAGDAAELDAEDLKKRQQGNPARRRF